MREVAVNAGNREEKIQQKATKQPPLSITNSPPSPSSFRTDLLQITGFPVDCRRKLLLFSAG